MSDGGNEAAGDDRPLPTSAETAMPVEDVGQEYAWVAAFTCDCGRQGTCEVQRQAVLQGDEDRQLDLLATKCSACGAERGFYFDVTELFAAYREMLSHAKLEPQGGQDD